MRSARLRALLCAAALAVGCLSAVPARAAQEASPHPLSPAPSQAHTVTYDQYAVRVDRKPLYLWGAGARRARRQPVHVYLGGACTRFTATVGVDDEVGDGGSASFRAVADGRALFTSPVRYGPDGGTPVDVDVTGARRLDLTVDGGGDISADHADWADARLTCRGGTS